MKKRILGWILALVMVCSLLPTVALAADTSLKVQEVTEGGKKYAVVTYTIPNSVDVNSVELGITFDKDKLKAEEITWSNIAGTVEPVGSDPDDANANGFFAGSWTTVNTKSTGANFVAVTAKFSIKEGSAGKASFSVDESRFVIEKSEGTGSVSQISASGATKDTNVEYTLPKLPISSVSATVDAPMRGTALDTSATVPTDAKYTPTNVKWYDGTNPVGTGTVNAGPSKNYKVEITLTANSGETFAAQSDLTLPEGYTIKNRTDAVLVITRTFPTTSSKELLTGTLTISGTSKVGETLTADVSALNDRTKIEYQWYRGTMAITGANSATYTLVKEDYQKNITVKVTATDASEYAGTVSSDSVTVGCTHTGGTATCQKKAKCTKCENYYGDTAPHDFDGVTAWGYKGADGHAHLCKNCNVAQDTLKQHTPGTPATLTSPQTCTACGYVIVPALKEIKNVAFTMTGYEFASKITDLKVTTASTEVNFAKTPYGEGYIVAIENGSNKDDVADSSNNTFNNTDKYHVKVTFSPKTGYAFGSSLKVTLNGVEGNFVANNNDGSKTYIFALTAKPADPVITRELTFTLKATQGGTARVPSEVFKIESVLPDNQTSTVTGEGFVTTNRGENTYTGTMQFKGAKSAMLDYATKTFYVRMVDGGKANWTYDTTIWQVTPNANNNDGTVSLTFNKITVTQNEDGTPEYALSETSSEKMEFEVIYTADASKGHNHMRRQPTTTNTTTAATNPSVQSPKTGDAGIALYAAMSVLSLTGGAWIVGKKRK